MQPQLPGTARASAASSKAGPRGGSAAAAGHQGNTAWGTPPLSTKPQEAQGGEVQRLIKGRALIV
eukprot:1021058-Pelagomonas_calceolata.AAC.3